MLLQGEKGESVRGVVAFCFNLKSAGSTCCIQCENHQIIVMRGAEVCVFACVCVCARARSNYILTYLRRHRFPVVQPPKHLPTSISCGKLATQRKAH